MASLRQLIVDSVLDSLPVGLAIVGRDGSILAASPSAAVILGCAPGSLEGRCWRDLLVDLPENAAFNAVLADSVERGGGVSHREVEYRRPDGDLSRLSLTTVILRQAERRVGVVVLFDDVTELRRARERETGMLLDKNRLQNDMIESMNTLALSVAHQIRNRTAAIGGFSLKLLRDLRARSFPTIYPEIIHQEAKRLEDIVGAVVRLASISQMHPEPVDIRPVLERAAFEASEMASRMGKKADIDLCLDDEELLVDADLLRMALMEILGNCLEFHSGPTVRISLTGVRDGGYLIRVADDGPGLAAGVRPFVFDPFYSTKPQGPGIGLTLARKIVIEHQGRISLENNGGKGLEVRIGLGGAGLGRCREDMGFDLRLLARKAAAAGIDVFGLNFVDAVRRIQEGEGYKACFGWGSHDWCGQRDCCFRKDCERVPVIGMSGPCFSPPG